MQVEIGMKTCFGLKSKVPFVTARFRHNLHWLWGMWRESCVWCLSHAASMFGEIGTKSRFSLTSISPFFSARFLLNFAVVAHCEGIPRLISLRKGTLLGVRTSHLALPRMRYKQCKFSRNRSITEGTWRLYVVLRLRT
jgi:hypothetical protein